MKQGTYAEVERTCRYGHGVIERVKSTFFLPNDPNPDWVQPAPGDPMHAPHTFAAHLYRCPTCGYLELADFNA